MAELCFGSGLYIGASVPEMFESAEHVVELLKRRKPVLNIYLCCMCEERGKLLEIINSAEIFKAVYGNREYLVVGLAHGKKEAFELVRTMLFDFIGQRKAAL